MWDCKVTERRLESDQNHGRKLHVHVLPYVKTLEHLPGVSTNISERTGSAGAGKHLQVKKTDTKTKSCELLGALTCLVGLLRLPITCSPLSTTLWCLLLTDTAHYYKHMFCRREGCMCSYMLKGYKMPNSTGTVFWSYLASSNMFTQLEETLRPLTFMFLKYIKLLCYKDNRNTKFDWDKGDSGLPWQICANCKRYFLCQ